MPPPRPPDDYVVGKDVLDIGCGLGRWLWEFQVTARSVRGLEMQGEYIELGRSLAVREGIRVPEIYRGSVEEMDRYIGGGSVDLCFARLVLNYVAIMKTLRKAAATLRPGGVLWVQVDSLWRSVGRGIWKERRVAGVLWKGFSIINTVLCMVTGLQASVRVKGRMHEEHKPAYPSVRWWRGAVRRVGLEEFRVESMSDGCVTFAARKP
jgi:SAM-dependent methyltransferase